MMSHLWDFAGADGLQVAKAWFGDSIDRLSPFQSVDITVTDRSCTVLRLCENNFRLSWSDSSPPPLAIPANQRVWLRSLGWLGAMILPDADPALLAIAVAKPPHRLPLPINCAAPARIEGISVLIWRHSIAGKPALEIHTATQNLPLLQAKFCVAED